MLTFSNLSLNSAVTAIAWAVRNKTKLDAGSVVVVLPLCCYILSNLPETDVRILWVCPNNLVTAVKEDFDHEIPVQNEKFFTVPFPLQLANKFSM